MSNFPLFPDIRQNKKDQRSLAVDIWNKQITQISYFIKNAMIEYVIQVQCIGCDLELLSCEFAGRQNF